MTYELFPSITPDGEPFVDAQYTREELERMDRPDLQRIAAAHESDDVNGGMSNEDIIAFMVGEERQE